MTTPNSGGYPRYGEDPRPGDLPSYGEPEYGFREGGYPQGGYPEGAPGGYPEAGYPQGGYPDGGYPAYQAGDEYSQFDVNSAASMSHQNALAYHGQQLADGYYGDGTQPHPINNPALNGWVHTKGTGRLSPGKAISWGFKAFGQNAGFWLVAGLIFAALNAVSAIPNMYEAVAGLAGLASFLLLPVLLSAALQQTLVAKFNSPKTPAYGKTLGMVFVMSLIAAVIAAVMLVVASIIGASVIDTSAIPDNPETALQDEAFMTKVVQSMSVALSIIALIFLLILPLFTYEMFYAADNNGGFGSAFGQGWKAGVRNWLPTVGLLLMTLLLGLIAQSPYVLTASDAVSNTTALIISSLLTVVLFPISLLMLAHAYRQVSGGPVPEAPAAQVA